jgi:hypothetical protein
VSCGGTDRQGTPRCDRCEEEVFVQEYLWTPPNAFGRWYMQTERRGPLPMRLCSLCAEKTSGLEEVR